MDATLFQQLMSSVVSPYDELVAYEYLYSLEGMTLRKITASTVGMGLLPTQALRERSGMLDPSGTAGYRSVADYIDGKLGTFDLAINGTPTWPERLRDSERPAPVIYYRGSISLIEKRSVSVVGSRKATADGLDLAAKISRQLCERGYSIVTGMARGVDAAATRASLEYKTGSIGVVGTPIDEVYPKENGNLFDGIVENEGLLISQVPFYRYSRQPFSTRRYYFPERNELMAAVSSATVIVEASDTSGTLSQARACQFQGRPLFITRHACEQSVTWPLKWTDRPNVHIIEDGEGVADLLDSMLGAR